MMLSSCAQSYSSIVWVECPDCMQERLVLSAVTYRISMLHPYNARQQTGLAGQQLNKCETMPGKFCIMMEAVHQPSCVTCAPEIWKCDLRPLPQLIAYLISIAQRLTPTHLCASLSNRHPAHPCKLIPDLVTSSSEYGSHLATPQQPAADTLAYT